MAHTFYASGQEYNEFRNRGFKVVRKWKDCEVGETVDIFGPSSYELGMTATVADIEGDKCLLEVW